MSWSTEFEGLMPHTINVVRLTGFSTSGYAVASSTSTLSSLKARVLRKMTAIKTFEGGEEMATHVIWTRSTSTFGPFDDITGSQVPTDISLKTVEHYYDDDGYHHTKLFMG